MAKDPYRYFRIEARELVTGLMEGVLQLEQGVVSADITARLLRLAHTLKGAARVVRQPEIAERAHSLEEVLTRQRDTALPLTPAESASLVEMLDDVSLRVNKLDAAPVAEVAAPVTAKAQSATAATATATIANEEPLETLRVEIEDMDALLRSTLEVRSQLETIRREIAAAERAGGVSSTLVDDVARLSNEVREIQDVAHRLRLTPASAVFPSLARAVRDAAKALDKRVEFETSGGDIRLDASVLRSLRDALAHVVRNAVVHGVESAQERAAVSKKAVANVRVSVQRRGSRVAFVCSDDGRGMNVDAVRTAAIAHGVVSESVAQSMSDTQVIELLRVSGVSTSTNVTELAGRGIGLDVAQESAAALKGEMHISSVTGQGATIEIVVPISIALMQGLMVETGGLLAIIPLDDIRETMRVTDADIARSVDGGSIFFEGGFIPFLPLERMLRHSATTGRGRMNWSAVVVQTGDRTVAVGVDRLQGTQHFVMRPLSSLIKADAIVAGATLDAEGNPQLVLDAAGIVAAADRTRGVSDAKEVERLPILVTDDSLTTRMLEQSILESAGYTVELATSAEEALVKARARRYSLFIVDVEMPGMDGFQFVTETRADPTLRDIPAILVTSRNAVEDQKRGEQAGAHAYIVKSEFDQDLLLRIIRPLIG